MVQNGRVCMSVPMYMPWGVNFLIFATPMLSFARFPGPNKEQNLRVQSVVEPRFLDLRPSWGALRILKNIREWSRMVVSA